MLQFDEMDLNHKIKIYDKYASYPNIKNFDMIFLRLKLTFILENIQTQN